MIHSALSRYGKPKASLVNWGGIQPPEWLIVVGLTLLVILLRWPSLEQPFDNDSGANAYHARLIGRGEPLYSTHHPAHHLPGVYYTYALAFFLFGDSVWSVKFFLIFWTIIIVYLIYHLGIMMSGKAMGVTAAIFYALLSSHVWLWGTTAQIELFANLPRVATVYCLFHLLVRPKQSWLYFLVGLFSLTAVMFKAVYFSPLALGLLTILYQGWPARAITGAWWLTLQRGLWLGLGFFLALLVVLAYFGALGLLSNLFLAFLLGQKYVHLYNISSVDLGNWLLYPFSGLAVNNALLLIYSLTAGLMIAIELWRNRSCIKNHKLVLAGYVVIWYILSFMEASASRIPFFHYYLLMIPSLALLVAWFIFKVFSDIQPYFSGKHPVAAIWLLILLFVLPLTLSVNQNFNYYSQYIQYKLGWADYQSFLLTAQGIIGPDFPQVQKLADYVQRHSLATDRLYYWSESMQLYYLADRRAPIEIIWPLYVEAMGPYQRIFGPQTKYIIVSRSNRIPPPVWLYPQLAQQYHLEIVIEDQEIYRRAN
jgi:4-amino-4-deoxy-L-arabinose transferase-like glycosyltransferase